VLGFEIETLVRIGLAGLLLVVVGPVVVVVHELAHAVVGRLMGFDVAEVQFGTGPAWWTFWVGRVRVTVRNWPDHGYVVVHYRSRRWLRARIVALGLAGPAADLASCGVAWWWASVAEGPWQAVAFYIAMVLALVALGGLVPLRQRGGNSDMALVLEVLRAPREVVEGLVVAYPMLSTIHAWQCAFEQGRLDDAQVLLAAHRRDPASAGWTSSMASLLSVARGDFERALGEQEASDAHDRAALPQGAVLDRRVARDRELTMATNRAFVLILIDRPEARAEALRLVAGWPVRPLDRREQQTAMARTRGLVLLRHGRVAEAMRALRAAVRGHEPHWLRALGMAHLAEAFVHARHWHEAARWARKARRLDPTGPLLPLFLRPVEAALAERRAPAKPIR